MKSGDDHFKQTKRKKNYLKKIIHLKTMDSAPILAGGGGFDDEPEPEPREGWLLVRVHVPELSVFKCLQFPSDRLVWDVKQQVLASLPKVSLFFHNSNM